MSRLASACIGRPSAHPPCSDVQTREDAQGEVEPATNAAVIALAEGICCRGDCRRGWNAKRSRMPFCGSKMNEKLQSFSAFLRETALRRSGVSHSKPHALGAHWNVSQVVLAVQSLVPGRKQGSEWGGLSMKRSLSSKNAGMPGHITGLILTLVPRGLRMSSYMLERHGRNAGKRGSIHSSSPRNLSSCLRLTNLWRRHS